MAKRSGLGRGLGALFADMQEDENLEEDIQKFKEKLITEKEADLSEKETSTEKEILNIFPNPDQPRKKFDEISLNELADSIRIHGVIQPLIVVKKSGGYMIIAGERRWRAAKIAGLTTVPVVIKDYSEQKIKEISLIENLQREDLNVIEAAVAIRQLMDEFKFTQEEVADRLGKARSTVSNTLRLLTLTPEVIKLIESDKLSAGHARCLVVVDNYTDQIRFALAASDNKLSVRELEKQVRAYLEPKDKIVKPKEQSPELKELVVQLTRKLGTKVSAIGNDNKGRIYIDYFTRDDLERVYSLIIKAKDD